MTLTTIKTARKPTILQHDGKHVKYETGKEPVITYKRKRTTQNGMSVNLAKSLSLVNNPIDQKLELYSSAQPEAFADIDIKMMSKLDKLRKLNEVKTNNRTLKSTLDTQATLENRIISENKAATLKKQIETNILKTQKDA